MALLEGKPMVRIIFLGALSFIALVPVPSLSAQESEQHGPLPKPPKTLTKDTLALCSKRLTFRFGKFEKQMAMVKTLVEKGTEEDKKNAKTLQKAIGLVQEKKILIQLQQLAELLEDDKFGSLNSRKEAYEQGRKLSNELQEMFALLGQRQSWPYLKAQRLHLEKLSGEIEKNRENQDLLKSKTADSKDKVQGLQKLQKNIIDQTKQIIQLMASKDDPGHSEDVKHQVEKALQFQQKALAKIAVKKLVKSVKDQEKSLQLLGKARKALTESLLVVRFKEQDKFLSDLTDQCQQLAEMQREIHTATGNIQKQIQQNMKINTFHKNDSLKRSDEEKKLFQKLSLISKQIDGMKFQDNFQKTFQQTKEDVSQVIERLESFQLQGEEGKATIALELKINAAFEKMIGTLGEERKAIRKQIGNRSSSPSNFHSKYAELNAALQMLVTDQEKLAQELLNYLQMHLGGPLMKLGGLEEKN